MSLTLEQLTEIFEEEFDRFVDTLRGLHDAKRKAYTGGRHPLENYIKACVVLTELGCRTDRGCLPIMFARLSEKLNRMASLAGQDGFFEGKLSESFEDTCLDVAVIAGLCAAEYKLLRTERNPENLCIACGQIVEAKHGY